jgi:hypothetical protein
MIGAVPGTTLCPPPAAVNQASLHKAGDLAVWPAGCCRHHGGQRGRSTSSRPGKLAVKGWWLGGLLESGR